VEGFGLNTLEMMSRGKLFCLLALQVQYRMKIVGGWIFMLFLCKNKLQFVLQGRQTAVKNLQNVTLGLTHVVGIRLLHAETRVGGYLYRYDLHILCLTNASCVNC
jgi:hypothetical protein